MEILVLDILMAWKAMEIFVLDILTSENSNQQRENSIYDAFPNFLQASVRNLFGVKLIRHLKLTRMRKRTTML
uniref:Uncharacterized protein n=1 Tax=Romanomermis culicivorax TaxID=13658 RepID=A0A915ILN3_ROMCU